MNRRLEQFLAAENISQSQFADTINVARASVSHVLAGRNKPSYDFIKSISDHYPKLSLDWLLNGKGKMYRDALSPEGPSPQVNDSAVSPAAEKTFEDDLFAADFAEKPTTRPEMAAEIKSNNLTDATQITNNQRSISKIVVFYDDGTYQELK